MPHQTHWTTRLALAGALLLAAGCGGGAEDEAESRGAGGAPREAVSVTLAPVQRQPLDRTVDVVGSLFGDEQTTLSAKVPGRVVEVLADVGDRVPPGAPLARIDPTDYELSVRQRELAVREALARLGLSELPAGDFDVDTVATVERARFQAANARARLDRARRLFEAKPPLISEQDFSDLQTAYEVARRDEDVARLEARTQLALARTRQGELETARQLLADATVRAPLAVASASGAPPEATFAVTRRAVSVGEYVREGDAVFDLIVDDPVKFRAAVPERFAGDLKVGQPVSVTVEGAAGPATGEVRRINPAVDPASRMFQVEAIIPNPERRLRPGAFARGIVTVGQETDVLFVPEAALVSFAGIQRVYTVDGGKAVEHIVEVGPRRDGLVAIRRSDLRGAREVIVGGGEQLAPGVAVAPAAAAAGAAATTTAPAGVEPPR